MCNFDDKLMVYLNLEYFNPFFCDQNLHSKWCSIICKGEQYTTMLPCESSTSNTGSSNLSIKWGTFCAPCMHDWALYILRNYFCNTKTLHCMIELYCITTFNDTWSAVIWLHLANEIIVYCFFLSFMLQTSLLLQ